MKKTEAEKQAEAAQGRKYGYLIQNSEAKR